MIKYLLNKFFRKEETSDTNTFTLEGNTIVFWTDKEGIPYLKIYVTDTDEDSAYDFALMIKDINTGQYIESIMSILVGLGSRDQTINTYIINLLAQLNQIYTNDINIYADEDEPQIKPTAFNNIVEEHE